jgi:signal recognition particle subunit SRP54
MFENLTEKLQRTFKNLRGQGKLTEEHLDAALAEIREALLEGDVNVGVADELLATFARRRSAPKSCCSFRPTSR